MSFFTDACNSISQVISIFLAIAGIFVALGGLIVSLSNAYGTYVSFSFAFFGVFCCKEVYEYSYSRVKLTKEVDRLDRETDQLEKGVDDIARERNLLNAENEKLKQSVLESKKTNTELKKTAKELEKNKEELNQQILTLKDQTKSLSHSLSASEETTNRLEQISNTQGVQLMEISFEVSNLKQSNTELIKMLENSKKMVTNLILAGDDYKNFNNKFGSQLTTLGQTSTDLKQHTELLGKIINTLAKQVPDDKIHQVEIAPEYVGATAKKRQKIQTIITKKNNALSRLFNK